jgi:hypothetical protein
MKNLLYICVVILLGGCSGVVVNGTMCDQVKSEPNVVGSQECRDYNEEDANKAFDKVVDEKKVNDKDIKFDKKD